MKYACARVLTAVEVPSAQLVRSFFIMASRAEADDESESDMEFLEESLLLLLLLKRKRRRL